MHIKKQKIHDHVQLGIHLRIKSDLCSGNLHTDRIRMEFFQKVRAVRFHCRQVEIGPVAPVSPFGEGHQRDWVERVDHVEDIVIMSRILIFGGAGRADGVAVDCFKQSAVGGVCGGDIGDRGCPAVSRDPKPQFPFQRVFADIFTDPLRDPARSVIETL